MSIYFSKFALNTYSGTPYFEAHLPAGYPLSAVLRKSHAFRRLPPNLRALAGRSKTWAARHPPQDRSIDDWYDADGYELDPDTGRRLSDAEVDVQWDDDPALASFVVSDIPVPPGGFPNPNTWEPTEASPSSGTGSRPTDAQLLTAIAQRGRAATAAAFGIPVADLPEDDAGLDYEDAKAVFARRAERVMESPYFDRRYADAYLLTEALDGADVYDDLSGAAKAVFDRAEREG